MSLRQGYGGKAPIVPPSRSDQEKSSQGAKRDLTVESPHSPFCPAHPFRLFQNKPARCRRQALQSAVNPEALRRDLHNKRAVCPTLNTSGNHTNQCEPDAPLHVSRSTQRGLPESSPLLVLLLSSPGAAAVIRPHANRLQYAVTNQPRDELFRDPVLHGPVLSARSGGTSGDSVC